MMMEITLEEFRLLKKRRKQLEKGQEPTEKDIAIHPDDDKPVTKKDMQKAIEQLQQNQDINILHTEKPPFVKSFKDKIYIEQKFFAWIILNPLFVGFGFIALGLSSPVAMGLLGFYFFVWVSYPIYKIAGRVVKAIRM